MRAIVLAGGPADREPNCPQDLPRPFWPVLMRPLVSRVIDQMARTGVQAVSVCANGRTALYADRLAREPLDLDEIRFAQDPLPRGPAGCVKDNESFIADETFVVANAACWLSDGIDDLVRRHRRQDNRLTLFCLPGTRTPSGVYVGEPDILAHIPPRGYCDIKEQLIPRLIDRGLRVGLLELRGMAAEVLHVTSYLGLIHRVLGGNVEPELQRLDHRYRQAGPGVWIAENAGVSSQARLFGPVVVGPGASVADGAIIIGPAVLGADSAVETGAILAECVVWPGTCIRRGACVTRSILAEPEKPPQSGGNGRMATPPTTPTVTADQESIHVGS